MRWLALALALALLLVAGWGYAQRRARTRLDLQVENAHQAAFFGLLAEVEALEEQLAALEAAQGGAWREGLTAARERARAAAVAAAGLPLPAQPLERSGVYLERVSGLAGDMLRRGQGPDAAALAAVGELRRQATYLREELAVVANLTGSGRVRWAAAAAAAGPAGDGDRPTPINRAVRALEYGWPAAPLVQAPAPPSVPAPVMPSVQGPAPAVAEGCAREFLARVFGDTSGPAALERDAATGLAYFAAATPAGTQVRLAVDGQCRTPYMLAYRPSKAGPGGVQASGAIRLQRREAEAAALAAAGRLGLGEVEPTGYRATDGVAVVTLTPVADGLVYFDEAVSLRIALDDGALLGLAARTPGPRPRALPAASRPAPPGARSGVLSGRLVYRTRTRTLHIYTDAHSGEVVRVEPAAN